MSDYIHSTRNFGTDDGCDYESGIISHHYKANGFLVRNSDVHPIGHMCESRDLTQEVIFREFHETDSVHHTYKDECVANHCPKCGWWQLWRTRRSYPSIMVEDVIHDTFFGVSHVFGNKGGEIIHEVADLIDREHRCFSRVSPKQLERSIAEVYRHFYGFSEVRHVGGPNDQGIDVLCIEGDETLLLQVKRRTDGKAESVSTVRDLIGAYALKFDDLSTKYHSARIMTTAERFSPQARAAVDKIRLSTFNLEISLHGYNALKATFDLATGRSEESWRRLAKRLVPRK